MGRKRSADLVDRGHQQPLAVHGMSGSNAAHVMSASFKPGPAHDGPTTAQSKEHLRSAHAGRAPRNLREQPRPTRRER